MEQERVTKQCLNRLCEASGQKVSYLKSNAYFSNNTDPSLAEGICTILEMPQMDDLGR